MRVIRRKTATKINMIPCKICQKVGYSRSYLQPRQDYMEKKQLCFSCSFWTEKLENYSDKNVTIEGQLYYVGEENSKSYFKGFGGRKFVIKKYNGEIIKTTNLWHNGCIPKVFRKRFPDDAKFVYEEPKRGPGYL